MCRREPPLHRVEEPVLPPGPHQFHREPKQLFVPEPADYLDPPLHLRDRDWSSFQRLAPQGLPQQLSGFEYLEPFQVRPRRAFVPLHERLPLQSVLLAQALTLLPRPPETRRPTPWQLPLPRELTPLKRRIPDVVASKWAW